VDELKKIGEDSVLGSTAMCGTHIRDTGGKFMIILGPLEKETFETFLPDSPNITLLKEIVDKYMTDPLEFSVEVKLKPSALIPVVLGNDGAPLGITSSCGRSLEKSNDYSILIGS
jgi:type VI secretion system protein ImpH